jgi:hypothetical protein
MQTVNLKSVYIIGAGGQGQKAARQLLAIMPDNQMPDGFIADKKALSEVYKGYSPVWTE